jgi:succinoglycan biosynthesis protein ExoL
LARIGFLAIVIAEASQNRRIQSIRSLGHDVVSLSFRRNNMNREFQPDWPNLDLGTTRNKSYFRRLAQIGLGLVRAIRARSMLGDSKVWIARNLDLMIIAVGLKVLTRRRDVKIVYECLDIHDLLTRSDAIGRAVRMAERGLLAHTDLLIVSSPAFVRAYFKPLQGYDGPVSVIENKLWLGLAPLPRPTAPRRRAKPEPLVLGWVGSLRCRPSLDILAGAAQALGPKLQVVIHGNVHRNALPDFDAVIAGHPNMRYFGPYRYPDDLHAIYTSCDLVWAQDLWQRGGNSDWLLPNRIYEASYFGCPSIALANTETGRRVIDARLGYTVAEPTADALVALLAKIDGDAISATAQRLLAAPADEFRLLPDELSAALAPVLEDE